ncbi:HlyU family transcriptional regulator [Propylenella binzhouense]|uniref:Transcriptional activator HlyU n=1 Tax=Propylenella binzhouense TaxID=2555902 RepID=A0A964T7G3_9HYPH|nr:HlyU family transcriptional regulator [Propylenella binzhouense]MYZ49845.1 hypothetical protein [Propylenella binzhouense]
MSFLRRLFGGGGPSEPPAPRVAAEESYRDYTIRATPIPEGGQFRLAATITKEIDGETKEHHLVRADILDSEDEAASFAIRKARQMIDQIGDGIFRN